MVRSNMVPKFGYLVRCVVIGILLAGGALGSGCISVPAEDDSGNGNSARQDHPWPHSASDLTPDPAIRFGHLPNGIRYIIMENREPSGRVSMHLNVQAGSLQEYDGEEGTAHFLEHMLFNGSTNFAPGELVKYFQRIGMQFGPDANAHTGFHETVYDILLADNADSSVAEGLTVLADYAGGALLLETEVDRERGIILAEKRTRDSVDYRTWVATSKFEMPDTLIPFRMPIGTVAAIKQADSQSLRRFYDAWYRPDNLILVIVGDIQAARVAKMVAETFAATRARRTARPVPPFGYVAHQGNKSFYHFEKEAGKTRITIETLEGSRPLVDNRDYRRERLLAVLGSRVLQHRIDARIGKQGTPYTEGSAGAGVFLNRIKYAEISAECNPANWEKTLAALEALLRRALIFGFTEAELDRVRKDYRAKLEHAVKNAATRQSPELARHIIRQVNSKRVVLAPVQEQNLITAMLDTTTLEQVNQAFRGNWSADHRLIIVTGNADLTKNGRRPEQLILDTYNRSRARVVKKPPEAPAPRFPYFDLPEKDGRVMRSTRVADLGILQFDLSNGVQVNLKPTDFEADQVAVRVDFGRGRSSEPVDKPGLGPLTESVINESGLGTLDKDTLKQALAGKNLEVDFKVAEDRFSYTARCVKTEIETLMQLLYAHFTDPGFRQDAWQYSLEKFAQRYQSLAKSVNGALTLSGLRFLAGGDGRFGLPDRERLARLTLKDVTSWIRPVIQQAPLEVSVVGDFDPQVLRALVGRYFGGLPARQGPGTAVLAGQPVFPTGQTRTRRVETRLPKGLTVVAYPTTDMWNIKRTRRLAVLAEVISERLRVGIREKLGAAYTTAAFNRPGRAYRDYGVLMVYVQVAPEKVTLIRDAVRQIIQSVVEAGITADELKRALDPTLSSLKDARRRNSYWLDTVLAGSRAHPEQLDWSREMLADYAGITVADIEAAAREYLVEDRAADFLVSSQTIP